MQSNNVKQKINNGYNQPKITSQKQNPNDTPKQNLSFDSSDMEIDFQQEVAKPQQINKQTKYRNSLSMNFELQEKNRKLQESNPKIVSLLQISSNMQQMEDFIDNIDMDAEFQSQNKIPKQQINNNLKFDHIDLSESINDSIFNDQKQDKSQNSSQENEIGLKGHTQKFLNEMEDDFNSEKDINDDNDSHDDLFKQESSLKLQYNLSDDIEGSLFDGDSEQSPQFENMQNKSKEKNNSSIKVDTSEPDEMEISKNDSNPSKTQEKNQLNQQEQEENTLTPFDTKLVLEILNDSSGPEEESSNEPLNIKKMIPTKTTLLLPPRNQVKRNTVNKKSDKEKVLIKPNISLHISLPLSLNKSRSTFNNDPNKLKNMLIQKQLQQQSSRSIQKNEKSESDSDLSSEEDFQIKKPDQEKEAKSKLQLQMQQIHSQRKEKSIQFNDNSQENKNSLSEDDVAFIDSGEEFTFQKGDLVQSETVSNVQV